MGRTADRLFADLEEPARAARLAAWMFLVIGVAAALALPLLATLPLFIPIDVLPVAGTCALLVATAAVLPRLPWARWPRWSTLVPAGWAMVLLGLGFGAEGTSLRHYLAFYTLVFLYLGLTQPPGRSVALLPLAVGTIAAAAATGSAGGSAALWVDAVITLGCATLLGEVLAWVVGWKRRARASVEDLLTATVRIGAADTVEAAAAVLARCCCELLGAGAAVVLLADAPGTPVLWAAGWHGMPALTGRPDRSAGRFDTSAGPCGASAVLRTGRPMFVPDARNAASLSRQHVLELGIASLLHVPIPGAGGCAGTVAVWWSTPRERLDEFAQRTTQVISDHAGQVLTRLAATERLETDARTDALTMLANRRELFSRLRALPVGGSVALLDLDFFKRVNDSGGHAAGDAVLAAFGRVLREVVRADGDCAARFGGEEFALLLPATGAAGAAAVVERLRRRWDRAGGTVTFSAGIAQRGPAESPAQCVRRADTALYQGKTEGRARTVTAGTAAERAEPAARRRLR